VLRPRRATPRVVGSSRDSVAGCRTPLSRDCGPFQSSSPLGRSRSSPLGRPSRSGVLMQRVLGYDALRSVSHTFRRHRLRIGIGPRQHSLAAGGGMGRAVLATVATERTDGLLSDGESTCSHSRLAFTLPTWSASRSPPCARRCRQQNGTQAGGAGRGAAGPRARSAAARVGHPSDHRGACRPRPIPQSGAAPARPRPGRQQTPASRALRRRAWRQPRLSLHVPSESQRVLGTDGRFRTGAGIRTVFRTARPADERRASRPGVDPYAVA